MTQAVQGMPKAALVYSVTEDSGLVFQPWGLISAPECNLVLFRSIQVIRAICRKHGQDKPEAIMRDWTEGFG